MTPCCTAIFRSRNSVNSRSKSPQSIGYDTNRGRQDEAAHPFCTNFSRDDVRITTRYDARFLPMSLYASMHEAGHAMYEQGSPVAYEGTPLAGGTSLGVHESQSRLWENLVGRSRAFSHYLFPRLQQAFPDAFANADVEGYYRAVNKVSPSLIRVEADEVTYNLHILMRFELETALPGRQTGRRGPAGCVGTRRCRSIWGSRLRRMPRACCRTCIGRSG